jgi:argininosuccinate lyase
MTKLWGGRFEQTSAEELELFSESISFDKRLYDVDIKGSIAHAAMLKSTGILTAMEYEQIEAGLKKIKEEIETGLFRFDIKNEDIHMAIEARLTEITGDVAKKLHTARSRNDQVALDTRLYVVEQIIVIQESLNNLRKVLVDIAENNTETIMPGYTHLQRAQVISLAHHMMAYYAMFRRDYSRLSDVKCRILNEMPLGCGALAGTTLNIDRKLVAKNLGFTNISDNSLDSVSDRDYLIELTSACVLIMIHLSRFSEELILWNSKEFNFIEISDRYATGSSMMPQKKNPDIPELVRGKSARVTGNLVQLLTLLKGTPLAYNRDFQEDKESLFDTIDTTFSCISIMTLLLQNISFNKETMFNATISGFLNATEAMEYLINKGIPNRDAHHITGCAVSYCIKNNKHLEDLSTAEWSEISEKSSGFIEEDIKQVLSIKNCLILRNSYGGPSPEAVKAFIDRAKKELQKDKDLK